MPINRMAKKIIVYLFGKKSMQSSKVFQSAFIDAGWIFSTNMYKQHKIYLPLEQCRVGKFQDRQDILKNKYQINEHFQIIENQ